ncbi:MAG TPA: hypothetical protein TECP_00564 [Hyphomicrobiaceae bacterium MAG_BT-2024]
MPNQGVSRSKLIINKIWCNSIACSLKQFIRLTPLMKVNLIQKIKIRIDLEKSKNKETSWIKQYAFINSPKIV